MLYVRPANLKISLRIRSVLSELFASRLIILGVSVKLVTEQLLEFLCLKGGCAGSSESTLVKMPHYWKPHTAAHIQNLILFFRFLMI